MGRQEDTVRLYEELAAFARRARALSAGLHPGLSLVAYTLLTHVGATPGTRGADLADHYALDKSTVSRQVDLLVEQGLLRRAAERPGRRGQVLEVTPAGRRVLAAAAASLQERLAVRLAGWSDAELAYFADLLNRFNEDQHGDGTDPSGTGPVADTGDP